jgi:predicted transcriptional regulator
MCLYMLWHSLTILHNCGNAYSTMNTKPSIFHGTLYNILEGDHCNVSNVVAYLHVVKIDKNQEQKELHGF